MKLRVLYHGHCFDGVASAATFTRFYKERIHPEAEVEYAGLLHRPGNLLFEGNMFDGDENAIVDFKYSPSDRLTWWFDHHQSAFLTPEDADHFRENPTNKKFYDPDFRSCTKFLATIAEHRFGFNPTPVAELIEWADVIDGAQYKDAKTAVEMAEPAMKLTMAIEATQEPGFVTRLIPLLATRSLNGIVREPFVAEVIPLLMERHEKSIEILRQRSECKDGTIYFDITDYDLEGYNKFIPYYLHPESTYSVGLSKSSFRTKVSVGSNPWTTISSEKMVNLAVICERYGGGGHARVGAISFDLTHTDRARQAASEIVQELRSSVARAMSASRGSLRTFPARE